MNHSLHAFHVLVYLRFQIFLYAHRVEALAALTNYRLARVAVFSTLSITTWCELLWDYPDRLICGFLEFGWPIGDVHV